MVKPLSTNEKMAMARRLAEAMIPKKLPNKDARRELVYQNAWMWLIEIQKMEAQQRLNVSAMRKAYLNDDDLAYALTQKP